MMVGFGVKANDGSGDESPVGIPVEAVCGGGDLLADLTAARADDIDVGGDIDPDPWDGGGGGP